MVNLQVNQFEEKINKTIKKEIVFIEKNKEKEN